MTVLYYNIGDKAATYEEYRGPNPVPNAIKHNKPLSDTLHVVAVISNPCEYKRRWKLALDFFKRMEATKNVKLYVAELCYGDQEFKVTNEDCPRHLQLRTQVPLWIKESLISVLVRKLLPPDWKAFAWIDADVEFFGGSNTDSWALDALKVLNGAANVVQLFSVMLDMDAQGATMQAFQGAAYQYVNKMKRGNGINFYHPGYAWAMTREFFEATGGLFETAILGSGDNIMFGAWTEQRVLNTESSPGYLRAFEEYLERCKKAKVRIGYIPYVMRHYFHGTKKSRGYDTRWKLLVKYNFDPTIHLDRDENGLVVVNEKFPIELQDAIMQYFWSRNEDLDT